MSGAIISQYWLAAMGKPGTLMVETITALYDVGAFFGAVSAAFTAEGLGRKRTRRGDGHCGCGAHGQCGREGVVHGCADCHGCRDPICHVHDARQSVGDLGGDA
jgi:hypothetical protein